MGRIGNIVFSSCHPAKLLDRLYQKAGEDRTVFVMSAFESFEEDVDAFFIMLQCNCLVAFDEQSRILFRSQFKRSCLLINAHIPWQHRSNTDHLAIFFHPDPIEHRSFVLFSFL